uniref:SET domain-containing protein n=1 Tax=Megaselia scalaris TaxID=36166 RepID=T1GYX0_MEGSC
MGRTKRRRSQKFVKVNACENQNNSNELLPLQKYLGTNFRWKNESKLICRYFDETERGICSKQRQKSNILIQLPIKSLITFKTILEDIAFIDRNRRKKKTIKTFFDMYEHLFGSNVCLQDLEWAYFIVQTRSVFVPEQKYTSAELELLVDEPQFGLAPFLDMFNHSSTAKNKLEILDNKYTLFSENNFKKAPSDFANVLSQIAYGSNCTEITATMFMYFKK